jgi:hypothetical protein
MRMIAVESMVTEATRTQESYRLYAERLQLWLLCERVSCRRARACRSDPLDCCRRFADWADAVRTAAQHERDARDPHAEILRSELGTRLSRLAGTLRDEP